jgi:hypothetical protein
MSTHEHDHEISNPVVLATLVIVACIAGIAAIIGKMDPWLAWPKDEFGRAAQACSICGVVKDVREVKLDTQTEGSSTISGEGFAKIFGLLTDELRTHPVNVYEIEVLLQDGSLRVIREGALPVWKTGDHVKIMMGRIVSAT